MMISLFQKCRATLDIEEVIAMVEGREVKKVKAIATYLSGRKEVYHGKLTSKKEPDKKFNDTVAQLRKLPTVKGVHVEKY